MLLYRYSYGLIAPVTALAGDHSIDISSDMIRSVSEVGDLRRAAGLTQDELAARSGVAQPNIAAYESGQRIPSAAMLDRLGAVAKPRPSVVLAKHRDAIIALARQHRASRVRVFGSAARGDDVSGSDIDLLVRFASDADVLTWPI